MLQKQLDDGHAVAFGGGREGALAARFGVVGERRVHAQQLAHALFVAERGGNGDGVDRAVG